MKRSKHLLLSRSLVTTGPSWNKKVKSRMNLGPKGISTPSCIIDEFTSTLNECFYRMLPHVWYKIFPALPVDVVNIGFTMRKY